MAKITRKHQKIFCGDAIVQDNIAQFGSLKASNPLYSDDPDVIQGIAAYGLGWKSAVTDNQAPPLQDMNALQYLFSRQLAYLFQAGIPEWNASAVYYINSITQYNGVIYKSLTDDNTNNQPPDVTNWAKLGANGPGAVPIGGVIATFPNLTGAYSCANYASDGADADGWVQLTGSAAQRTVGSGQGIAEGQVLPLVNDDVFLMGSASASGADGGANAANLEHAHNISHYHAWGFLSTSLRRLWSVRTPNIAKTSITTDGAAGDTIVFHRLYLTESGASTPAALYQTDDMTYYTTGVLAPKTGSDGANAASDLKLSATYENRPKFITAKMLMRIK